MKDFCGEGFNKVKKKRQRRDNCAPSDVFSGENKDYLCDPNLRQHVRGTNWDEHVEDKEAHDLVRWQQSMERPFAFPAIFIMIEKSKWQWGVWFSNHDNRTNNKRAATSSFFLRQLDWKCQVNKTLTIVRIQTRLQRHRSRLSNPDKPDILRIVGEKNKDVMYDEVNMWDPQHWVTLPSQRRYICAASHQTLNPLFLVHISQPVDPVKYVTSSFSLIVHPVW